MALSKYIFLFLLITGCFLGAIDVQEHGFFISDLSSENNLEIRFEKDLVNNQVKLKLISNNVVCDSLSITETYGSYDLMEVKDNKFLFLDLRMKAGYGHKLNHLFVIGVKNKKMEVYFKCISKDEFFFINDEDTVDLKYHLDYIYSDNKIELTEMMNESEKLDSSKSNQKIIGVLDIVNNLFYSESEKLNLHKEDGENIYGSYHIVRLKEYSYVKVNDVWFYIQEGLLIEL